MKNPLAKAAFAHLMLFKHDTQQVVMYQYFHETKFCQTANWLNIEVHMPVYMQKTGQYETIFDSDQPARNAQAYLGRYVLRMHLAPYTCRSNHPIGNHPKVRVIHSPVF